MKYLIGLKHQLSCIESGATILIKPVLKPAIQAEGGCAFDATDVTSCHVVITCTARTQQADANDD